MGVGQRQPANEPRQLTVVLGPDDKVPMVRHDAIGQQSSSRAVNGFLENPLEGLVIGVLLEDRHPRIGPVEHMVDQATVIRSLRSSHTLKSTEVACTDQQKTPDTLSAPRGAEAAPRQTGTRVNPLHRGTDQSSR